MLKFLKRLFSRKPSSFTPEEHERHYEAKKRGLEHLLGPMHDMVGHSIVPFEVGGAVDMYYFLHAADGTACATMELIQPDGSGPVPNSRGTFELVAFSRALYPTEGDDGATQQFERASNRLCSAFTTLALYASDACLKPGDTCEIPIGQEGTACVVFDDYGRLDIGEQAHGLLLCIEVFRSEMDFARENGSAALLTRLKEAGHYPYSDLDRSSVA